MIDDLWYTDADVDAVARELWDRFGRRDLGGLPYEFVKRTYREMAEVAIQALSRRKP